jgi:hypothetical protein
LFLRIERVARGGECHARYNVAEERRRKRDHADDGKEVLGPDTLDFGNDLTPECLRSTERDAGADAIEYRLGNIVIEEREECADNTQNDNRKSYLQCDDVCLCAEKWIVPVPIQQVGNQFREPFRGDYRCFLHRAYAGDF